MTSGIIDKHAFLTSRLESLCLPPETFLAADLYMQEKSYWLGKMDKLCQMTLRKFKIMLPELEPKSGSERREIISRILTKYHHN